MDNGLISGILVCVALIIILLKGGNVKTPFLQISTPKKKEPWGRRSDDETPVFKGFVQYHKKLEGIFALFRKKIQPCYLEMYSEFLAKSIDSDKKPVPNAKHIYAIFLEHTLEVKVWEEFRILVIENGLPALDKEIGNYECVLNMNFPDNISKSKTLKYWKEMQLIFNRLAVVAETAMDAYWCDDLGEREHFKKRFSKAGKLFQATVGILLPELSYTLEACLQKKNLVLKDILGEDFARGAKIVETEWRTLL